MSNKTLRASLYFLGAVTALYVLVTLLRSDDERATSGVAAALASINGQQLTRIEFASPLNRFLLQKEGDGWTVNHYVADTAVVHRLLRAIDSAEVREVAAANPDHHLDLGITADSARKMVTDGGVTILFGKHARNRSRTGYVRLPDSDTVHFVYGDLRYSVGRTLFEWRNKVMLRVDTSAVAAVHVTRDGATTVYERRDSTWTVNGEEASARTVRNTIRDMLQELAEVRASGFVDEDFETEGEIGFVRALDADGNELASLSLSEGSGSHIGSTPASPYVFRMPRFRFDRIMPEPPGEDEG